MEQSTLDLRPPDLATAKAVGHVAQQLATARAERDVTDFRSRAEAAVLERLQAGKASAEDLTDYVRSCGIPFKDGRAMGNVYKTMKDRGLIRIAGACLRKHGNGTSGGHIWERCS
ncbi:MAG: hypothetical protein ACT6S0_04760 [Roseateles sp.]|uniref:hypothetical protein n=1 Tax=Roseateles sp. TaxID=1971397 RepID=UPI0040360790